MTGDEIFHSGLKNMFPAGVEPATFGFGERPFARPKSLKTLDFSLFYHDLRATQTVASLRTNMQENAVFRFHLRRIRTIKLVLQSQALMFGSWFV
jgi:hypothetical protein